MNNMRFRARLNFHGVFITQSYSDATRAQLVRSVVFKCLFPNSCIVSFQNTAQYSD